MDPLPLDYLITDLQSVHPIEGFRGRILEFHFALITFRLGFDLETFATLLSRFVEMQNANGNI